MTDLLIAAIPSAIIAALSLLLLFLRRRQSGIKRTILPLFGLALILALLSPIFMAIIWHLRYGHFVQHADLRVPIPLRWLAYADGPELYIAKPPITLLRLPKSSRISFFLAEGSMSLVKKSPLNRNEREHFYASVNSRFWAYDVTGQDVAKGPFRIGAGENEAVCWQSTPKANKDWFNVLCIFRGGTWSTDFHGNARDKETFFQKMLHLPVPGS
jgi:hypothetical protein